MRHYPTVTIHLLRGTLNIRMGNKASIQLIHLACILLTLEHKRSDTCALKQRHRLRELLKAPTRLTQLSNHHKNCYLDMALSPIQQYKSLQK